MSSTALALIDELDPRELEVLQEQIIAKRLKIVQAELKSIKELAEQTKQSTIILSERIDKVTEVATNSLRVQQPKYDYINQRDFGVCFGISIGSKTVGKLFKAVGLAQKSENTTVPYRHFIPRYVKTFAHNNFTSFVWHYENCLEYIEKWLKENSLFEEFYSIATEREMEEFINKIYQI